MTSPRHAQVYAHLTVSKQLSNGLPTSKRSGMEDVHDTIWVSFLQMRASLYNRLPDEVALRALAIELACMVSL